VYGDCGVHVANQISPTVQKLKTFFCRAKTKTNTVSDSKLNSCGSGTGMTGAGDANRPNRRSMATDTAIVRTVLAT